MCSDSIAVQCHTVFGNSQCSVPYCFWQFPMLSAAVQTRLTAGLGHCKNTYGDLLSVQVCSDPIAVQCHTAFGNCPLLSAAVQNKLTAGSGHCKYTYGDLLSVQGCSDPTAVQCHTALKNLPPAQCGCAKKADSRLGPLQIHLGRLAVGIGVQ